MLNGRVVLWLSMERSDWRELGRVALAGRCEGNEYSLLLATLGDAGSGLVKLSLGYSSTIVSWVAVVARLLFKVTLMLVSDASSEERSLQRNSSSLRITGAAMIGSAKGSEEGPGETNDDESLCRWDGKTPVKLTGEALIGGRGARGTWSSLKGSALRASPPELRAKPVGLEVVELAGMDSRLMDTG
jgi:hypothetical protein